MSEQLTDWLFSVPELDEGESQQLTEMGHEEKNNMSNKKSLLGEFAGFAQLPEVEQRAIARRIIEEQRIEEMQRLGFKTFDETITEIFGATEAPETDETVKEMSELGFISFEESLRNAGL